MNASGSLSRQSKGAPAGSKVGVVTQTPTAPKFFGRIMNPHWHKKWMPELKIAPRLSMAFIGPGFDNAVLYSYIKNGHLL